MVVDEVVTYHTHVTMDRLVASHIVNHLNSNRRPHPLFVALQGPQGCGKSYLSAQLKKQLAEPPHSINVVVLSIDDLYLRQQDLAALAAEAPRNPLWAGRGQPGTHDIDLGTTILRALHRQEERVELPIFNKSLCDGRGDRLSNGLIIHPPIDVVILEGWCVGFSPISQGELDERWDGVWKEERQKLSLPDFFQKRDLERVNEALKRYTQLWSYFDLLVQVRTIWQLSRQ